MTDSTALMVHPLSVVEMIDHMEQRRLTLGVFSDGEFFCVQGAYDGGGRVTSEGACYTAELKEALREAMQNRGMMRGMTKIAANTANACEWLQENDLGGDWYWDGAILNDSLAGELWPLRRYLFAKRVVMVGPAHLRRFRAFPLVGFVESPPRTAFEERDRLEVETLTMIDDASAEVVLLSCGTAAPILVSRLVEQVPDVSLIDTGSIWDMYVGILSRSGPRHMTREHITDLGRRNFHQDVTEWWLAEDDLGESSWGAKAVVLHQEEGSCEA